MNTFSNKHARAKATNTFFSIKGWQRWRRLQLCLGIYSSFEPRERFSLIEKYPTQFEVETLSSVSFHLENLKRVKTIIQSLAGMPWRLVVGKRIFRACSQ